jgi:hypothetical protein
MKKRSNLMFLKNKALAVFRFGHKEDPEVTFLEEGSEFEIEPETIDGPYEIPIVYVNEEDDV